MGREAGLRSGAEGSFCPGGMTLPPAAPTAKEVKRMGQMPVGLEILVGP